MDKAQERELVWGARSYLVNPRKTKAKVAAIPTNSGYIDVFIYSPEDMDATPTAYFDLHGGGWMSGCALDDEEYNLRLTKNAGVKVFSIEYRLAPENPFPCAIDDVSDCVSFIMNNYERFGIKQGTAFMGGQSAGGNIAIATYLRDHKKWEGFSMAKLVLGYAPYDNIMPAEQREAHDNPYTTPVLFHELYTQIYADPSDPKNPFVSPLFAADELLCELPECLLIMSRFDSLRVDSEKMFERLKELGVSCDEKCFDQPHGFNVIPELMDTPEAMEANRMIYDFLRK